MKQTTIKSLKAVSPVRNMNRLIVLAGLGLVLSVGFCLSAQARDRMRIDQVNPTIASPGETIEITGDFGALQGNKVVMIFRVINRQPVRYIMRVDWSAHRIRARLPNDLAPDQYLVFVYYAGRPFWASNKRAVTIRGGRGERSGDGPRYGADRNTERAAVPQNRGGPAPTPNAGGMLIEHIKPDSTHPGDTIDILGVHFGSRPAGKIVAINLGRVNRAKVLHWSDNRIKARVPNGLAPGEYRVLIYYDNSFRTSSNSLPLSIIRPR